jgi:hypothetical protein
MHYLTRFLEWHEDLTYKWLERLQITEYQAMLISFLEGALLTLLLVWIF